MAKKGPKPKHGETMTKQKKINLTRAQMEVLRLAEEQERQNLKNKGQSLNDFWRGVLLAKAIEITGVTVEEMKSSIDKERNEEKPTT